LISTPWMNRTAIVEVMVAFASRAGANAWRVRGQPVWQGLATRSRQHEQQPAEEQLSRLVD
jgi:hypothetical protein